MRLYLGLAVGVAALVAAAFGAGLFQLNPEMKGQVVVADDAACASADDVGNMRMVNGRPQVCVP